MFILGLEVFYQVAGQTLLLLYATTNTKTTGGLETVFKKNSFMGFNFDPLIILALSIGLSLKSCFGLHLKTIKIEKHFVPYTSKILILLWGIFASIRRILSIVSFFLPSLGLFNILYHSKAEQIPFTIWKRFNKTQNDPIVLYGLNETVLWGDLDRWDYTADPDGIIGIPPGYLNYTGISLGTTFGLFFIIAGTQFLFHMLVKIVNTRKFSKKNNYLNKFLHLVQSLNIATPFEDWDQGKCSLKEYRKRHRHTNIEMAWSLSVNIVCSLVMLVPLWYTGI